jgi:hypothetical protein
MKKKKQQIKTVRFKCCGLWFFFHSKFLTFCCVCLVALHQRVWEEKGRFSITLSREKSDYKKKGVTDTRIITSIVTRRRRKTRKKQKEEERKHEFCRRQAHFRSKHVLGVRQQEGKEEEEECHRFFSASKDAKEEFSRLC